MSSMAGAVMGLIAISVGFFVCKLWGYGILAVILKSIYDTSWKAAIKLVVFRAVMGLVMGLVIFVSFGIVGYVVLAPMRFLLWWAAIRWCFDGRPRRISAEIGFAFAGLVVSYLFDALAFLGGVQFTRAMESDAISRFLRSVV